MGREPQGGCPLSVPGGLAAIKDTVTRAVADAGPLKTSLARLADDFRALGVAMSSVTPPPGK